MIHMGIARGRQAGHVAEELPKWSIRRTDFASVEGCSEGSVAWRADGSWHLRPRTIERHNDDQPWPYAPRMSRQPSSPPWRPLHFPDADTFHVHAACHPAVGPRVPNRRRLHCVTGVLRGCMRPRSREPPARYLQCPMPAGALPISRRRASRP